MNKLKDIDSSTANYILKFDDVARQKEKISTRENIMSKLLLFASVMVSILLLIDTQTKYLVCLILCIVLWRAFRAKTENVRSPSEFWFFDDYMVFYYLRRVYSTGVVREEYYKANYSSITKCLLKTKSGRILIYGVFECEWYNYNKGILNIKPDYEKVVDAFIYPELRYAMEDGIDVIKIIEENTPLRFTKEGVY